MSSQPIQIDPFAHPAGAVLAEGAAVAVRNRFDGMWSRGFRLSEAVIGMEGTVVGYRVRRETEQFPLPAVLPVDDVIPVRT